VRAEPPEGRDRRSPAIFRQLQGRNFTLRKKGILFYALRQAPVTIYIYIAIDRLPFEVR